MKRKQQIIYSADFVYAGKTHKEDFGVIVENGKILEAGNRRFIKEQFPYAKEVKLDGALYPGFIDSHLHLNQLALYLSSGNAEQCRNFKDLKKLIYDKNAMFLYNLDFNTISILEWKDLFKYDYPLFIQSTDEHSVFINSALIKRNNIDIKETSGGEVVKLNGEFVGVLKDNAINNVKDIIKRKTNEEELQNAKEYLLQNGVVAVTNFDSELFNLLKKESEGSSPKLRVFQSIACTELDDAIKGNLKTGEGSKFFRIGAVKCFLDGSLGSQTALMQEGYFKGLSTLPAENFKKIVKIANENGLQVAVHAIGSKAVKIALQTFNNNGKEKMRNRIEHLQFINEGDLSLLRKTEFIASMQPFHYVTDREIFKKYIGKYKYAYAWKTVLSIGKTLAFGSDAPVVAPSVINGIKAAVGRNEEGLTTDQAIIAYTEGAARANFYERYGGRIVYGLNADFTLLSKPIVDGQNLEKIRVYATIIGGERVWTM